MSEVIRCPAAHQTMWEALGDKEYRESFAEAFVEDFLASQIHSLRAHRGWNQTDLAQKAGVTQPMVSDWERSCEGIRLTSLQKLAGAFDVALQIKFVPFSVLAREAVDARADLPIPSFDNDSREAIRFGTFRMVPTDRRPRPERNGSPTYVEPRPELRSEHRSSFVEA